MVKLTRTWNEEDTGESSQDEESKNRNINNIEKNPGKTIKSTVFPNEETVKKEIIPPSPDPSLVERGKAGHHSMVPTLKKQTKLETLVNNIQKPQLNQNTGSTQKKVMKVVSQTPDVSIQVGNEGLRKRIPKKRPLRSEYHDPSSKKFTPKRYKQRHRNDRYEKHYPNYRVKYRGEGKRTSYSGDSEGEMYVPKYTPVKKKGEISKGEYVRREGKVQEEKETKKKEEVKQETEQGNQTGENSQNEKKPLLFENLKNPETLKKPETPIQTYNSPLVHTQNIEYPRQFDFLKNQPLFDETREDRSNFRKSNPNPPSKVTKKTLLTELDDMKTHLISETISPKSEKINLVEYPLDLQYPNMANMYSPHYSHQSQDNKNYFTQQDTPRLINRESKTLEHTLRKNSDNVHCNYSKAKTQTRESQPNRRFFNQDPIFAQNLYSEIGFHQVREDIPYHWNTKEEGGYKLRNAKSIETPLNMKNQFDNYFHLQGNNKMGEIPGMAKEYPYGIKANSGMKERTNQTVKVSGSPQNRFNIKNISSEKHQSVFLSTNNGHFRKEENLSGELLFPKQYSPHAKTPKLRKNRQSQHFNPVSDSKANITVNRTSKSGFKKNMLKLRIEKKKKLLKDDYRERLFKNDPEIETKIQKLDSQIQNLKKQKRKKKKKKEELSLFDQKLISTLVKSYKRERLFENSSSRYNFARENNIIQGFDPNLEKEESKEEENDPILTVANLINQFANNLAK